MIAWLGENPICYYLVGFGALVAFVTMTVRQPADKGRSEIVFLVSAVFVLLAWRWPTLLAPYQLNPDESTWVASARKATADFVPWRGFDTGTSGPLNSYILLLPALVGLPISFASARFTGIGLMGTAIVALYYAVKWLYGARIARLALVPPILLLSLTTDKDFVHYSSEQFAICLTTVALSAAVYLAKPGRTLFSNAIAGAAAGLCAGSACFTKLQAAPLAAVVLIFAGAAILTLRRRSKEQARVVALVTLGAGCLVPAAIAISLWWTGTWHDAFLSYIRTNIGYIAGGNHGLVVWIGPTFFFKNSMSYGAFLMGSLVVLVLAAILLAQRRHLNRGSVSWPAASILLSLTAFYVIWQPHRAFEHYLLFSIFPLSFCVANALGLTSKAGFWKGREFLVAILFAALFVLPSLAIAMRAGNGFVKNISQNLKVRMSAPAAAIARYAKPGEAICVWGWASEYYVQTGTFPAARESETGREIIPSPYREYFRRRFLSDLKKRNPVVFVDAVASSAFAWSDRPSEGHEIFPALAAYIREHYDYKEEIYEEGIYGIRIYTLAKSSSRDERRNAKPFPVTSISASSYYNNLDAYKPENAFDVDERTEWAAQGSDPAVITITFDRAGTVKAIRLLSRQTTLFEGWQKLQVKRYLQGERVSEETFSFPNAATQRLQEVSLQPLESDKIELSFAEPVTTTRAGQNVPPWDVNPGYAEIVLIWQR